MASLRQLLTLGFLSTIPMCSQPPAPPIAPHNDHRETRHGATVIDPYFWLREKSSSEVVKYLEAENAYTAAMTGNLKPFSDAIYQEMLGHIKQTDLSVPTRRGDYFYYSRTEEGKQYPIQCRRKGTMDGSRRGPARSQRPGQGSQVRRARRLRRFRRPQSAGLHHRLHGLPPVRPAGKGSAQRTDSRRYHRPRHFHGLGRR